MCSPAEMAKIAPIVRECPCLRSIIIMDRSGSGSFIVVACPAAQGVTWAACATPNSCEH